MSQDISKRGEKHLRAMAEAAPDPIKITGAYAGKNRVLMLYGPGSRRHMTAIRAQHARGGRVVMWDLGYWDRATAMRLSIEKLHPTAAQLAASQGPARREFVLREDADPAGPILLIGLGAKSVAAYDLRRHHDWERRKLADLRRRYPGRAILWRPKGAKALPLDKLPLRHGMPIEEAMLGCSLVACRHSNVAVDACLAGIQVECEDGAAHALYGNGPAPSPEARADFLRRLSYWEWHRNEAPQAWDWINHMLEAACV